MNPLNYVPAAASTRPVVIALRVLVCIWVAAFFARQVMGWNLSLLPPYKAFARTHDSEEMSVENAAQYSSQFRLGHIRNKVALIVETQYTQHLLPLILHFHGVLGPEWPIVFYTSEEMIAQHLSTSDLSVWQGAVASGAVDVRPIPAPKGFDLSTRVGVNQFLVDPWLWEGLAPAEHVLLFQSDSIICANSPHRAEDFLHWDFIGAPPLIDHHWYHGGLTLRNRTMIMEILEAPHDWLVETKGGTDGGGEDIWFANKMMERGAMLPAPELAIQFAVEFDWNWHNSKTPFGFHKVHAHAAASAEEIRAYCPEIALASAGVLDEAP
ncbi:unnamed protein product [Discula destructiva]